MSHTLYLSHPEVVIDPTIPTPRWGLSEVGRKRLQTGVDRGIFDHVEMIISSSEQKAIDSAMIIDHRIGVGFVQDPQCDENERSALGFVPPEQFEKVADQFFAEPDKSAYGWETARNAQQRVVDAVREHLRRHKDKNVLFVGHGAVGTLLKCQIGGRKIARNEDQRRLAAKGGGNIFAFDRDGSTLFSDWTAIEDWPMN
ncbi:histidine phosphatase family protein [Maritalea sp.]|uniref:histidine phosphatase family protein n=1 Tax=Maritalea sp. TaxID=2003361 RepID=UPI003EFA0B87